MKALLGKYHVETCYQYQTLLEQNGVNHELHEPPMEFIMAEGVEHLIGEIYVNEEDLELAKLILKESETFSEELIKEKIKPEIKNQFGKGIVFIIGAILLGVALLPHLNGGKYDLVIVMGIIVTIVYFIRKKETGAN